MRRAGVIAWMVAALACVPVTGSAQWLRYPTEGIPRLPDGKPNFAAPAPRLPDGQPDLSGIWHAAQPRRCTNSRRRARSRAASRSAARRSAATSDEICRAARCPISRGRPSSSKSGTRRSASTIRTCAACPTTRRGRGRCRI